MQCTLCAKDVNSPLSEQDSKIAQRVGLNATGYKCDQCNQAICLLCYMKVIAAQANDALRSFNPANPQLPSNEVKHIGCGGTFK